MRQDVTGFFTMLQGDRARGGVGIRAPARGSVGIQARARSVRGFRPGRGVGIRTPGAGCGFGPRARGGMGIRARARGGSFLGVRWEIFYLFAVFSPFG